MQIRPLDDRLVVQPIPLPEGRVKVVEFEKQPWRMGKVVAVGPGKLVKGEKGAYYRRKCDTKVGQIVQFGPHSIDMEWNGLCFIREADVLVVEN